MTLILLASQTIISRFKKKAKRYSRDLVIPHCEALELVAVEAGFKNWHELANAGKRFKPTEDAYRSGIIVGFEYSEAPHIEENNDFLFPDRWVESLPEFEDRLSNHLGSLLDPDDLDGRPFSETLTRAELMEHLNSEFGFMSYYRVNPSVCINTLDELLTAVGKLAFWPPRIVFMKGKLIDTYDA